MRTGVSPHYNYYTTALTWMGDRSIERASNPWSLPTCWPPRGATLKLNHNAGGLPLLGETKN